MPVYWKDDQDEPEIELYESDPPSKKELWERYILLLSTAILTGLLIGC